MIIQSRRRIHRRRRPMGGVVVAVIAVAAIAALVGFVLTRPSSLAIAVDPPDAVIRVAGLPPVQGVLSARGLKPGAYAVKITRRGFAPYSGRVTVKRFFGARERIALKALPYRLRLASRPTAAAYSLTVPNATTPGAVRRGKTPVVATSPAGTLTATLAKPGYNTLKQAVFLDRDRDLTFWLDKKGQLVHCLTIAECGPAPKAVAFTPDSKEVWVTILDGLPSVEIYDPTTGARTGGIRLGKNGAVELVFSADGATAYASQMQTALVYEIDTATHKVFRTLDTKSSWSKVVALSPDGKTLYVSNWIGNDVSEIDLATGSLRRRLPTMKTPRGLYPTQDGKYLYVAGFGKGELERVDLATGVRKEIFVSGGALRHLVADATRGLLYASDMAKDVVWVTDMKTGKTRKFVDTDEKPNTIDLTPDGKVLFVSCRGENNAKSYYIPGPEWGSILLFDTASGRPLDAIVGGNQTTALDVSPDGRSLVFSDFLDNRLRTYSIPSHSALVAGGGGRYAARITDIKK